MSSDMEVEAAPNRGAVNNESSDDEMPLARISRANGKRAQVSNGAASSDDDERPLVSLSLIVLCGLENGIGRGGGKARKTLGGCENPNACLRALSSMCDVG